MTAQNFVPVSHLSDLPDGEKKVIEVDGVPILLCHHDARVYAIHNLCSHADQPLDCGRVRAGWIACPVHGARFDLESGEALNPPATSPITTYAVSVADDGTIAIAL